MDRRTLLTGTAAAAVAATAAGRLLLRAPGPEPPPGPPPAPPPAARPPSPSPARAPSPSPPAPGPSPAALAVPVLCRDAWGARPAADGLVGHDLRRMTIHHSAVPLDDDRRAPARLRQHQRHHQERGWPDVAYHLAVDRRGHVYELRRLDARGDTATDYDPTGHLLLLAEGDFDRQQPTDAQLEGLVRLLAWGASDLGLPLATVSGHRDHAATACPGDALYARIPGLRRRAAALASDTHVTTTSRCGPEAAARVADLEAGRG